MESSANTESGPVNANAGAQKATRERSQIEFPYSDMGQAEALAVCLMTKGGGSADPAQLASWLDQSANGGSFRSGLSAARIFGFVESDRGTVRITQDGKDVTDADKASAVRVEAFLRVPLFAALFDKFKGYALPPAAAIERQMVDIGVPTKQKERARQVFQKSANRAGFVDQSSGRLTKPSVQTVSERKKEGDLPPRSGGGDGGGKDFEGSKTEAHNPFIAGLLSQLPSADKYTTWPLEDQAEWLTAAASIFKLLSKAKGRIEVVARAEVQTPTGVTQSAKEIE